MIYLLLFLMIILFFVSYLLLNRDLFEPAVILCMAYIVSILSTCININLWSVDIHFNTFLVILLGTCMSILTNFIVIRSTPRNGAKNGFVEYEKSTKLYYINVQLFKTILVCLLQLWIVYIYYKSVTTIASSILNYNGFSEMMTTYRAATSYGTDVIGVSTWVNQLVKISYACATIYLYIFINNLLTNDKGKGDKNNYINLIPVIIYGVQVILTGGRFNLLILVCGAFIMHNILWHRKVGWSKTFGIKFLAKCMVMTLLVFTAFYLLKETVGRTNESDFITYITRHAGGSIQLFDMYMQNHLVQSNIWGKETFYALNDFMRKIGLLNIDAYIQHLEFRNSNGIMIGNVYTAYRRNIQDFGITGMLILQFLYMLFYSLFYNHLKYKKNISKIDYHLLAYASIAFTLFLHPINDYFYSNILSINYLIIFILLWVSSWFIVRIKIRI